MCGASPLKISPGTLLKNVQNSNAVRPRPKQLGLAMQLMPQQRNGEHGLHGERSDRQVQKSRNAAQGWLASYTAGAQLAAAN